MCRLQQSLSKVNSASVLKVELEFGLSDPVSIGLSPDFALDEVGTKHGLLQFNLSHGHERKAERLELVFAVAVQKDGPVRRQEQLANFVASHLCLVGATEVQSHIVAAQQDTGII